MRRPIESLPRYASPILERRELNLDLNENPAGCSPRVLEKLRSLTAADVAQYPQRETGEIAAAALLGLDPDQVMLTNGIDEALQLLCQVFLDEHSQAIVTAPTFPMYRTYAGAAGAHVQAVPFHSDFSFPIEPLLAAINDRTRLVLIANPNNPTGTVAPAEELVQVLDRSADAAVVIDEAYFEFYGRSMIGEIASHPNLVVTRTFSKAYGLAGLRLGVVAATTEQISPLRRIASPFNINSVALACLPEALADTDFVDRYVKEVIWGREQLSKTCNELGLHCWPSQANFVLVRIGDQVAEFVASLRRQGVMVSDRSADHGCHGCVRITVPARKNMPRLLEAMEVALRDMRTR